MKEKQEQLSELKSKNSLSFSLVLLYHIIVRKFKEIEEGIEMVTDKIIIQSYTTVYFPHMIYK